MNFEEMSDGELSWKIHHIINNIPKGYATICIFDINNPSDMMPIVFENKIAIIEPDVDDGELWSAGQVYGVCEWHKDKNPLRAAAIFFLKMMEAR